MNKQESVKYGSFISDVTDDTLTFYGLSEDKALLPKAEQISNLETGTRALCIDTGEVLIYEKSKNQWYSSESWV